MCRHVPMQSPYQLLMRHAHLWPDRDESGAKLLEAHRDLPHVVHHMVQYMVQYMMLHMTLHMVHRMTLHVCITSCSTWCIAQWVT